MTQRRSRVRLSLAVAAVAGLALAGCAGLNGSSSDPDGSTGDLTPEQYEVALDYVGGEAGRADDSLEPVKIGFINVEGGTASFPEVTVGTKAAAEFVNEYLGGVQGHPLEIETCFIVQGDEDALKCAQDFVNDPSIVSIQLGMTIFGSGPIFSTVGDRKPIIGFGPFGPADVGTENAIFYGAAGYAVAPGTILRMAELGVEKLTIAYDDNPAAAAQVQLESALAPEYGIDITAVPVANASEWSTALVSAGAQTADAVALMAVPSSCVPAAQAIQQAGITVPVFTTELCFDPSLAEELGDWPTWSFVGQQRTVVGNGEDADIREFVAAMEHFAPDASLGGSTSTTFGLVLSQVRAINAIGVDALTPDALRDALWEFEGPVYLGPDRLACGEFAAQGAPSLCAAIAVVTTYEGDDVWSAEIVDTEGQGLGG